MLGVFTVFIMKLLSRSSNQLYLHIKHRVCQRLKLRLDIPEVSLTYCLACMQSHRVCYRLGVLPGEQGQWSGTGQHRHSVHNTSSRKDKVFDLLLAF